MAQDRRFDRRVRLAGDGGGGRGFAPADQPAKSGNANQCVLYRRHRAQCSFKWGL
ncbi:hypothetical protein SDC9_187418 [bioreactor metagenome]|uniref:Uncharacterized protein n=1 Tax=bioreactor metagenome TaxID=1076179 RepID=A0A645HUP5_9ZZZZ